MKRVGYFDKIDTKEKAYILGFLIADGHIEKNNQVIEVATAIKDKEIIEFISKELGSTYNEDLTFNKQKRIFPKAETFFYSKKDKETLIKLFGGRLKEERRIPRINVELEKYLIKGIFDADGCITWGFRKDRNRLWQKVSITSSLSILTGVQQILLKNGISTIVRPKTNENCFIIEFGNEYDIYMFYKYIKNDLNPLKRKEIYFNEWIGETIKKYSDFKTGEKVTFVDKRTLKKYNITPEYDKIGEFIIINVKNNKCDLKNNLETIKSVDVKFLSKKGISNYALRLELEELREGTFE